MIIGGTFHLLAGGYYQRPDDTNQEKTSDLKFLDRCEVRVEVKLGQDDNLISAVGASVADNNQGVDVTLREQAKADVCVYRLSILGCF